jgi:hypothetical protein
MEFGSPCGAEFCFIAANFLASPELVPAFHAFAAARKAVDARQQPGMTSQAIGPAHI